MCLYAAFIWLGVAFFLCFNQYSDFFVFLCSFRRYFSIVISHYQVALYTARQEEMIETVQKTLFYMNPEHPIPVHSTYATMPYEVCTFFQFVLSYFLRLCVYIRLCRVLWRSSYRANKVFLRSPSRDGSGIRRQDRVVLSP